MHGNIGFEKNQWKVEEDETVIVDPAARKLQVLLPLLTLISLFCHPCLFVNNPCRDR